MAHVDRKQIWVIFVWLAVLTILEVGVVYLKGTIGTFGVGTALVGMALVKATLVGLFYMHLRHETSVLRFTVALPLAMPLIYALVLIVEAAWRLFHGMSVQAAALT